VLTVASDGKPVRVTVPVIDCESPLSSEVTMTVQVVDPPFQSMVDGVHAIEVEVPAVTRKFEDEVVELVK
jgi:hypothetical protein